MPLSSVEKVRRTLQAGGYVADDVIATAVFLSVSMEKPILIEGPPGVGKTALAKALSAILELPLVRLQCYEGIDEGKALYDWEYGKQLLYTQLLRTQLDSYLEGASSLREAVGRLSAEESLFFSEHFLVERPVLKSFRSEKRSVLLIDEIDRSDDEFEALLLESLSEFQISIPELGMIEARQKPLVILTSNGTRLISDALRRRCLYLHIGYPDLEREVAIIRQNVPATCEALARQLVGFVHRARTLGLRKPPSVSESLDWARVLSILGVRELSPGTVVSTAGAIAKHQADLARIQELAAQELA
ncbi:AAA family ATPase [Anaeromyxobacter oryzae]|uniref:ATPase n=1 Tax=Anaeromyxobacter oryzae TaxID=2918170 RepID=A0ABM7X198_9BACT|nr:MoxR family ATPase [Anaeromyxobacter oryzae]BDG05576.1 ATPase [Anaeromyxobacter oryzae]